MDHYIHQDPYLTSIEVFHFDRRVIRRSVNTERLLRIDAMKNYFSLSLAFFHHSQKCLRHRFWIFQVFTVILQFFMKKNPVAGQNSRKKWFFTGKDKIGLREKFCMREQKEINGY